MVHLDVVRAANSALVKAQPLVAVFVGGTSGVGEQTIYALAATHAKQGSGLRLYIVGRNADAAQKIIAESTRLCPGASFRFMQAKDLALLEDVDRICAEIIRIEEDEKANGGTARVDLLVMSQALLNFQPRTETKEGLDADMSLLYYSRMRFIIQLLPLLLAASPPPAATAATAPAHIISIYAAGMEDKLFPEDLSLRDPKHYSFANCRSHVVYMKTLFMESLAERHRGRLSLVHVFPGLVITETNLTNFDNARVPAWVKLIWRWLVVPLVRRPFSVPPRESGERVLFLATPRFPARRATNTGGAVEDAGTTAAAAGGGDDGVAEVAETIAADEGDGGVAMGSDGKWGSGAYAVNWDGEVIPTKKSSDAYKNVRREDVAGKVWDHTMRAFEEIASGNVFHG